MSVSASPATGDSHEDSSPTLGLEDMLFSGKDIWSQNDPFFYFGADNFLPVSVYEALRREFPGPEHFTIRQLEGKCRVDHQDTSSILAERPTWRRFVELLREKAFIDSVFDFALPGLRQARGLAGLKRWRLCDENTEDPGWGLFERPVVLGYEFSRYPRGAILTPHTDKESKMIIMLLYFPDPQWRPEYGGGTDIYAPKDSSKNKNWMNRHLEHDQVETLCSVPFTPNTLAGFVKSRDSWHGVSNVNCPPEMGRNSFIINYLIPSRVMSRLHSRAISSFRRRTEARFFRDVPDLMERDKTFFRTRVGEMAKAGHSDGEIAKELGLPPGSVEKYRAQSQKD